MKANKIYWSKKSIRRVELTLNYQPSKMVKDNQTTCRLLPTNYLSVFDHFMGLTLKGLTCFKPETICIANQSTDFYMTDSLALTLSWWRSLSHRTQSTDLQSKSLDWFLCDRDFHHEIVKWLSHSILCNSSE